MEADWEFEIGGNSPIIEAHWPGFVDLRIDPSLSGELAEARQLPGLAEALARLNAMNSPVWTSKTDVFVVEGTDADELDATAEEATHAVACYVDLLSNGQQRDSPSEAELACKGLCAQLKGISLRRCRVDLVVRRAHIGAELKHLGMTAYLTACGQLESDARSRLVECLAAFAEVVVPEPRMSVKA